MGRPCAPDAMRRCDGQSRYARTAIHELWMAVCQSSYLLLCLLEYCSADAELGGSNLPQFLKRLLRALRRQRPLRDRLHQLIVAVVEIISEVELSVADVGRAVRDVHRDLLRQL